VLYPDVSHFYQLLPQPFCLLCNSNVMDNNVKLQTHKGITWYRSEVTYNYVQAYIYIYLHVPCPYLRYIPVSKVHTRTLTFKLSNGSEYSYLFSTVYSITYTIHLYVCALYLQSYLQKIFICIYTYIYKSIIHNKQDEKPVK